MWWFLEPVSAFLSILFPLSSSLFIFLLRQVDVKDDPSSLVDRRSGPHWTGQIYWDLMYLHLDWISFPFISISSSRTARFPPLMTPDNRQEMNLNVCFLFLSSIIQLESSPLGWILMSCVAVRSSCKVLCEYYASIFLFKFPLMMISHSKLTL